MNRRQQGQRVKQIVMGVLGTKDVRVRSGRGTAFCWWYIIVEDRPTEDQKDAVEKACSEENLLGYFWSEYGYGSPDARIPEVLWKNREGRVW